MINSVQHLFDDLYFCLVILALSLVFSLILGMIARRKNKSATIQFIRILFAPGVIIHELSHYGVCKIFSVRVGKIVLFQSETISGSLEPLNIEEKSPLQLFYISFAPMFTGMFVIYYLYPYITSDSLGIFPSILLFYALLSILISLHISIEDFNVFIKSFKKDKVQTMRDLGIVILSLVFIFFLIQFIQDLAILFGLNMGIQYVLFCIYRTAQNMLSNRRNFKKKRNTDHRKNNNHSASMIPDSNLAELSQNSRIMEDNPSDLWDPDL